MAYARLHQRLGGLHWFVFAFVLLPWPGLHLSRNSLHLAPDGTEQFAPAPWWSPLRSIRGRFTGLAWPSSILNPPSFSCTRQNGTHQHFRDRRWLLLALRPRPTEPSLHFFAPGGTARTGTSKVSAVHQAERYAPAPWWSPWLSLHPRFTCPTSPTSPGFLPSRDSHSSFCTGRNNIHQHLGGLWFLLAFVLLCLPFIFALSM